VVDVGITYEEDIDRALAVVRDEAAQFSTDKLWGAQLDGPLEVPGIESLSDRAVVIRTLLRTHPGKQWEVARGFRFRILERLGRERIAIAALPSVSALGGGVSRTEPAAVVPGSEP
jgi:small conductance mechanosensitive channel